MAQSIIVLHPGNFFSLDNAIIDVHAPRIGALGVAIYTTLARYANRKTGQCWPSVGRIAHTLKLARSTVKVHLRKLERAGLIAISPRRAAAGDPTSHLYTLRDPAAAAARPQGGAPSYPWEEGGGPSANLPLEEGGPGADLPPATSQPTGGSAPGPEPTHPNHAEEENHTEMRSGAEATPATPATTTSPQPDDCQPTLATSPQVTPRRPPCQEHPAEELSRFGDITICRNCWWMIDPTTVSPVGQEPEACAEGVSDTTDGANGTMVHDGQGEGASPTERAA